MLYKATKGDIRKWAWCLHHMIWVDRVIVKKGTGCSPYFIVMGTHPTIPLDIIEVMWLVKYPEKMLSKEELIGLQVMALAKHVTHVEEMREKVTKEKI